MNFQQLRIIREAVRRDFNLTEVASVLATSQSGVSKHIRDIEDELGAEIFLRRGKRLLGLTKAGQTIMGYVETILTDAGNIKRLAEELRAADQGALALATTHTQARYALPSVISGFRKAFPQVRLALHQTSPTEITSMLLDGRADIGIATEALALHPDLVTFPYYTWHHAVVVAKGHPLEGHAQPLSLQDIAAYPIITYHAGFTGRPMIDRTFEAAGIKPDIVMAAMDADVIKAYVGLGLGIGLLAAMSVDAARETGLSLLRADHLFAENTSYIALRRGRFQRGFACRFIALCRPDLSEAHIRKSVQPPS